MLALEDSLSARSDVVEAQNRHQIYKVAMIATTAQMDFPDEAIAHAALINMITADSAVAIDSLGAVYEIRPGSTEMTKLTDYFIGLEVKPDGGNPNNRLFRWSGTAWEEEWDVAVRNRALLQGGFLLTEGATVNNLTEYTGSVIGEPFQSYFYDNQNDTWLDADRITMLIGF